MQDGEPYIKIKFNRKIRDLPAAETESSDDAEPSNDDDTAVDSFSEAEDTREARIERVAREEERMKEAKAAERRRREVHEACQSCLPLTPCGRVKRSSKVPSLRSRTRFRR